MAKKKQKAKRIKEKHMDAAFSLYIKNRDNWTCQFPDCGLRCLPPTKRIQCSHFFTRAQRSTRFEPINAEAMCSAHHRFLEIRKNAEYLWFKIAQIGNKKFNLLVRQYRQKKKWSQEEYAAMMQTFSNGSKPNRTR